MEPFKFWLVADPHYFAKSLDARGHEYDEFMTYEQKCYAETAYINDAVFDMLEKQTEADVILFAGDLSFNGEKASHEEFSMKLKKLQDSGKDLYVVTAGHDIEPNPFAYDEQNGRKPAEGIKFFDLYDYYRDFGYDKAISLYKENLCYCAQISDGVRLLVLCNDSKDGKEVEYSPELLDWAKQQMDDAKRDSQIMIAMEHFPLLPGQPIFQFVPDARQKKSREVINFLADNGVHVCFTGHMHNQSVNETVSDNGSKFYDVCTGSIIGAPAFMRLCTLTDENTMEIKSVPVPDFEWDTMGMTCTDYMWRQFDSMIRTLLVDMESHPEKMLKKVHISDKKFICKVTQKFGTAINNWTLGKVAKILAVRIDNSIKDMMFADLATNVVRNLFAGNQPYVEDTPEGDVILRVLKRLKPVWKILDKKMHGCQGEKIDMYDILKNTIGNYGLDDYNVTLHFV